MNEQISKNKASNPNLRLWLHLFILVALVINIAIALSLRGGESGGSFKKLEITFINTPDCEDCFSLDPFREYFAENGVDEDNIEEIDYDSFTAKRLLNKLEITQVPTVVVKGNVENYEFMQGLIDSVGEIRNEYFVVTKLQPPYLDLETDELVGKFELIYLDDGSCTECYDVTLHDEILDRLALNATNKRTVDISSDEGKEMVDKYFITAVPTILLTGELEPYDILNEIWDEVGSIEYDGTYVLRKGIESMGPYKALPGGEIIFPVIEEDPLPELSE